MKNISEDYPIFMAMSEAVGHDRRGNPLYKKDSSGVNLKDENDDSVIWNDLREILSQWVNYSLTGTVKEAADEKGKAPSCFVIDSKQIMDHPSHRICNYSYPAP